MFRISSAPEPLTSTASKPYYLHLLKQAHLGRYYFVGRKTLTRLLSGSARQAITKNDLYNHSGTLFAIPALTKKSVRTPASAQRSERIEQQRCFEHKVHHVLSIWYSHRRWERTGPHAVRWVSSKLSPQTLCTKRKALRFLSRAGASCACSIQRLQVPRVKVWITFMSCTYVTWIALQKGKSHFATSWHFMASP